MDKLNLKKFSNNAAYEGTCTKFRNNFLATPATPVSDRSSTLHRQLNNTAPNGLY